MVRFSATILAASLLAGVLFLACGHESPATPSVSPSGTACTAFTLAGVKETFGPSGGSATVTVTGVPAGCGGTWSATSSASWLTVTTDLLVSGGGRVTYQVAANPGVTGERSGTLTVAGQSVVVKQVSSMTFEFTGGVQTWVVPSGVTLVDVDAYGAAGGVQQNSRAGASRGGRVQTTLSVSPGQTLYVYVGGAGTSTAGGFNGGGAVGDPYTGPLGGGGGASDIRIGGSGLENRAVVAGGGGGGGCYSSACVGGPGGGLVAAASTEQAGGCLFGVTHPAGGGSQSAGGVGGACYDGSFQSRGASGNLGIGGTGGGGSVRDVDWAGGGGGGGYYGGGGGGAGVGGGGGSSYSVGTNTVHTPGVRSDNGLVVIAVK